MSIIRRPAAGTLLRIGSVARRPATGVIRLKANDQIIRSGLGGALRIRKGKTAVDLVSTRLDAILDGECIDAALGPRKGDALSRIA